MPALVSKLEHEGIKVKVPKLETAFKGVETQATNVIDDRVLEGWALRAG